MKDTFFVYVVLSGNRLHSHQQVGAVFLTEEDAKAEVKRLTEANTWTRARYVERQVAAPEEK